MRVWVYVCIKRKFPLNSNFKINGYVCMNACEYVYTYVYMNVYVYVCICMDMYVYFNELRVKNIKETVKQLCTHNSTQNALLFCSFAFNTACIVDCFVFCVCIKEIKNQIKKLTYMRKNITVSFEIQI